MAEDEEPLPGPSNGHYSHSAQKDIPVLPFYLTIRFASSSLSDLEITVKDVNQEPPPTVAAVKRQIRVLRLEETHNRRLRLILSGKILNDNVLLKTLRSQHLRHVPLPTPSVKGKEKETVPRLWIHCSMGELLSDEEFMEEEERDKETPSTIPLPVGFDRLRSAGFTDDDIASLREQFQRLHGARISGEDESTDIAAMEERWLDETIGLGNASSVEGGWISCTGKY